MLQDNADLLRLEVRAKIDGHCDRDNPGQEMLSWAKPEAIRRV